MNQRIGALEIGYPAGGFNPEEQYWSTNQPCVNSGGNKKCLKPPASYQVMAVLQYCWLTNSPWLSQLCTAAKWLWPTLVGNRRTSLGMAGDCREHPGKLPFFVAVSWWFSCKTDWWAYNTYISRNKNCRYTETETKRIREREREIPLFPCGENKLYKHYMLMLLRHTEHLMHINQPSLNIEGTHAKQTTN